MKDVDLEKVYYKLLDEDFERDAVSFCHDSGLNTTPYIAKTIAKHFFELGLNFQSDSIDFQNIDDTIKEEGFDPYSKEAKIIKESYYKALENFKVQKGK